MSTTTISDLANKTPSGSMYTVIEDSGSTGKTTINNLVSSADIIGSTSMGTTATTITGAIAEHEADLTELNGKISGFAGTGYISIGAASSFNISYSGGGNAVFFLFALNRRSGSTPFSAVVQKYSGGTNYSVLGGTTGSFTTSAISTGIAVTMPDTYFDVLIIGSIAFTLST